MKKTVLTVGGFIVLGVLCYVGRSSGQTQTPPSAPQAVAKQPAPARTRIALLNLTYVIKNYKKWQYFQDEIKRVIAPSQEKDANLRKQLEDLAKQAQADPSRRDELEPKAKKIQHEREELQEELKLQLGKRSDEEMKIVFMDVCEAAQRYAVSHDFELVLHYNDAVTEKDYVSARNIARKLNTGALMPLYWQPNMDISVDVARMLNYNVSAPSTPGAAPGVQPTGGQR